MDMSHIAGIVGLISGLITIVSAGVAVTRYFRRHPEFLKVCIDFLEGAVFSAIVVALVGGLVFGLGFVAVNGVDFVASKIRSPAPTPTDIVTPTPSFTLPYQNSLLSQAARWTTDDSHNCFWGDGGLHVLGNDRCYPPVGEPSDVTITVQVSQIAGAADVYYGVTIRLIPESPSLFFGINSAGYWEVVDCDPEKCTTLIDDL